MKRLFGTDGIRGVAGDAPLDPATVRRFGAALADTLASAAGHAPRVVFGRDTRESGPWLRDAVAVGLAARGASAVDAGIVTTPALAHATRAGGFDAGVMISASHNPFRDNGLKVFSREGVKLPDDLERTIEARILDGGDVGGAAVDVPVDGRALRRYLDDVVAVGKPLRFPEGQRLLVDCANGSAVSSAPSLLRRLGLDVDVVGAEPDGRNINLDCGSTHLDGLRDRVVRGDYALAIAFDGDADRCLAVDRRGRIVDGDHILYLAARHLRREGRLRGDKVVATIMTNFWLERRLAEEGMTLVRAPVGDKYVLERMVAEGAALGGEQSGHIIYRDHATTGDGLLTAVLLLVALGQEDRPMETLLDGIVPAPQILLNVRVSDKPDLLDHPVIGPAARETERLLEGRGRVVLRYSGTEPLARVMVEGDDDALVRRSARHLAAVIENAIGV